MTWIQTFTGKAVDLEEPAVSQIDLTDIAHALSNLCRYTGHSRFFYSVGQHSVLASKACSNDVRTQRWALLHDASEAYLNDLSKPLKMTMDGMMAPDQVSPYTELELAFGEVIAARFDLGKKPEEIGPLDLAMLEAERRALLGAEPRPWMTFSKPAKIRIEPWNPLRAQREFLTRARTLGLK